MLRNHTQTKLSITLSSGSVKCVKETNPENFWAFYNDLYSTQNPITQGKILNTATETTNLTEDEISEGLDSEQARNELEVDQRIANGNGVTSTPTVYVNGQRVGNDWESLKSAVENNLE